MATTLSGMLVTRTEPSHARRIDPTLRGAHVGTPSISQKAHEGYPSMQQHMRVTLACSTASLAPVHPCNAKLAKLTQHLGTARQPLHDTYRAGGGAVPTQQPGPTAAALHDANSRAGHPSRAQSPRSRARHGRPINQGGVNADIVVTEKPHMGHASLLPLRQVFEHDSDDARVAFAHCLLHKPP